MWAGGALAGQAATAVLDLVLPRPCPGCGGPGPWCSRCAHTIAGRPRRVRYPGGLLDATAGPLPAVYALARYRGPARAAILAGKERGRRDLPRALGTALGTGLERLLAAGSIDHTDPGALWLVPAPSRRSAARRRGGDPVTAMARAAARRLAAAGRAAGVAPCVYTARGAADSLGLDPDARLANLAGRVRWAPAGAAPVGAPVVLLDDVLTTGATIAATLRLLGPRQPVLAVIVVASVPRLR